MISVNLEAPAFKPLAFATDAGADPAALSACAAGD